MTYIFVEGPDDERYVARIIQPLLGESQIIQYAHMEHGKLDNFIKTIDQVPGWDYIFLGDADGKSVAERREVLGRKHPKISVEKIFIVQFEIESWYYAGATEEECKKNKLRNFVFSTDTLTKEQFYAKLLRASDRTYILECLLDVYSLALAMSRNNSLRNFVESIEERTCGAV